MKRLHGRLARSCHFYLRLGKREKFKNLAKAQVHSVGTAAMNAAGQSVLENVQGYDDSFLTANLDQAVDCTTFFGLYSNQRISCMSYVLAGLPILSNNSMSHLPASPRLSPSQFGSPSSRPREYRLTWKSQNSWQHALCLTRI